MERSRSPKVGAQAVKTGVTNNTSQYRLIRVHGNPSSLDRRATLSRLGALSSILEMCARSRCTAALSSWISYCAFARRQQQTRKLRRCVLALQHRTTRACLAQTFRTWKIHVRAAATRETSQRDNDPPRTPGWTWTPEQVTNIFAEFCDRIETEKTPLEDTAIDLPKNKIGNDSTPVYSPFDQLELKNMIGVLENWQDQYHPRPSPHDRVHQIILS